MMEKKGMGWIPDYPDFRDCKLDQDKVQNLSKKIQGVDVAKQADKRISKLAALLNSIPNLPENIARDIAAFRNEIDNQINFLSATFVEGILSRGSTGKEVTDLQQNLKDLGYCNDGLKLGKSFDETTENAVKDFQRQQNITITGIVTAVTRAELIALAAISKSEVLYYSFGDIGSGVIYLQQQLLTLRQKGCIEFSDITEEECAGSFKETTKAAVEAFQKWKELADDGIVGKDTAPLLRREFDSHLLQVLKPPISLERFEKLADIVLDFLIAEARANFVDPEDVRSAMRSAIYPGVHPIIEVVIQLVPYLDGYDEKQVFEAILKPGQFSVEEKALIAEILKKGYEIIRKAPRADEVLKKADEITRKVLKNQDVAADIDSLILRGARFSKGRGYVSSSVLDYNRVYGLGNSGSAIIYLQERLRSLGYYKAPVTGYFEQLTQKAVKDFQADKGNDKDGDGLVGLLTRAKLYSNDLKCERFEPIESPALTQLFDIVIKQLKIKTKQETNSVINSIVKVIAQLIAPIGKHKEFKKAVEEGYKSFKYIANRSRFCELEESFKESKRERGDDVLLRDIVGNNNLKKIVKEGYESLVSLVSSNQSNPLPQSEKVGRLVAEFEPLVIIAIKEIYPIDSRLNGELKTLRESVLTALFEVTEEEPSPPTPLKIYELLTRQDEDSSEKEIPGERTFVRVGKESKGSLQAPLKGDFSQKLEEPTEKGGTYLILPTAVDLSLWCTPIEDQGLLDSCTAHAGVALIEFFEKKNSGKHIDVSRRFLYKVTRNLMNRQGDSGASVRETMKAMALFGLPPEEYWSYDEENFDQEPPAFCYAYGQNYQAITYFRLDDADISTKELLAQIKLILAAEFPCMFGFTVYDSIDDPSNLPGHIPYPSQNDRRTGGHAAVAVGYNDYKQIKNASTPGALLIKNSWGQGWGEQGYGWLPYDYVLKGLARDWWSLIKAEWFETGGFGLGSEAGWLSSLGKAESNQMGDTNQGRYPRK